MGKKWRYKDPDLDCRERYYNGNEVSYNAVEYCYPEISQKKSFRNWETKNTAKFREMFKKNKELESKTKIELNSITEINSPCTDKTDIVVKKKKSKQVTKELTDSDTENCEKKDHKKSKLKKKSKQYTKELTDNDTQNCEQILKKDNKKSKLKKKSKQVTKELTDSDTENCEEISKKENHKKSKLKKGKKCEKDIEIVASCNQVEDHASDVKKRRAKKRSKQSVDADSLESAIESVIMTKKTKKKAKRNRKENKSVEDQFNRSAEFSEFDSTDTNEKSAQKEKLKKKKKIKNKDEAQKKVKSKNKNKELVLNSSITSVKSKKKMKSRCDLIQDVEISETLVKAENINDSDVCCVKKVIPKNNTANIGKICGSSKKSKKKIYSEEISTFCTIKDNLNDESVKKRKKRPKKDKTEKDDVENDLVEPPAKKKKKNSKRLQTQSDEEHKETNDIITGQWAAASFDTSQQKDKFMRLMGGVKVSQSLNTVKSQVSSEPVKFNSALTKEKETKLNLKLEEQFNNAISIITTKGKGSGLGFEKDPAEGKKFYIDTRKSNSVKFDD